MTGGGVTVDKEYGMTTVDLNNSGFKDKPFVLKNDDHSIINEPNRHIVLSGKRNIVGIEDKSDM